MFTAEEARKLAKEVKDKKELLAKQEEENNKRTIATLAEPIIQKILDGIKLAIEKEEKLYKYDLWDDVEKFDEDSLIIQYILLRIKELKFNVIYRRESHNRTRAGISENIAITWDEKDNLIKTKVTDKEIQDLIKKVFNKPDEYFEHKPIYWWRGEFPKQSFM